MKAKLLPSIFLLTVSSLAWGQAKIDLEKLCLDRVPADELADLLEPITYKIATQQTEAFKAGFAANLKLTQQKHATQIVKDILENNPALRVYLKQYKDLPASARTGEVGQILFEQTQAKIRTKPIVITEEITLPAAKGLSLTVTDRAKVVFAGREPYVVIQGLATSDLPGETAKSENLAIYDLLSGKFLDNTQSIPVRVDGVLYTASELKEPFTVWKFHQDEIRQAKARKSITPGSCQAYLSGLEETRLRANPEIATRVSKPLAPALAAPAPALPASGPVAATSARDSTEIDYKSGGSGSSTGVEPGSVTESK